MSSNNAKWCPRCGGEVVIEDGNYICIAPGMCYWTEELTDSEYS